MKMIRCVVHGLFIAASVVTMTELLHWIRRKTFKESTKSTESKESTESTESKYHKEPIEPTDPYDEYACHSYILKHKHVSYETIIVLLRYYPLSLSCGSSHTAIVVSDQTPGYETKDRPFRVLASQWSQHATNLLDGFPSVDQMARYIDAVSYVEIARNLPPLFQHAHMFERAISGVRWSRVIDRLLADGLVSLRTAGDGQRILTAINGVQIDERPVDALLADGAYETLLLSLLVHKTTSNNMSDSLPSDFSTHVHEASTAAAALANSVAYDVVEIAEIADDI